MTKKELIKELKKEYNTIYLKNMPKWVLEHIYIKDNILRQVKARG